MSGSLSKARGDAAGQPYGRTKENVKLFKVKLESITSTLVILAHKGNP